MTDKNRDDEYIERAERLLKSRFPVFETPDELIASINGPMANAKP